jgi:hypothetical protein
MEDALALVAELVDALVSGTSGESRGGSSPLQGTKFAAFSPAALEIRLREMAIAKMGRAIESQK